jgi:hypothetical protein
VAVDKQVVWSSPILNDLPAEGPHPELAEDLMLFGQFVGAWDMTVEFFDDGGHRVYREPGTWTFGWVLDGRAIQDVLVYPPVGDPSGTTPGTRRLGTSLRYLNPRTRTWQVIWLGASTGLVVILHGGRAGDDILLESEPEPDGTLNRWRFTDITADGFVWTGHESSDDGATWHLRQRMTATRKDGERVVLGG